MSPPGVPATTSLPVFAILLVVASAVAALPVSLTALAHAATARDIGAGVRPASDLANGDARRMPLAGRTPS